jgi:SSS family solute:Na+ symporter
VFIFITVGTAYHIGPLSNLYFLKTEGMLSSQMTPDLDKIIPLFINKAMPVWFGAVFMLCMLSAGMSTLSAQFHTMGAAMGADILPEIKKERSKKSSLGVRFGVVCSIFISYAVCYALSANIIARGTALFMGICAATFLPTYFCSLYWKKATKAGALASLWTGALTSVFCMIFLHRAEAAPIGICKALLGRDVLVDVYPWFAVDPLIFALPLSTAAIIFVSIYSTTSTKNKSIK